MTLTDETEFRAARATDRYETRRVDDLCWGDDELPFADVPRPRDWWGILGGVLAALIVTVPWFLIVYRFATGGWPWTR